MHLTDQQYDDLNQQLAEVEMDKSLHTTQHTPGPWAHQALAGNHDFAVYSESDGKDLALVRHFHEANATLIAAAPDLLAAVEAQHKAIDWLMARLIGFDESFTPSQSKAWSAVVMGHEAIAKATQTL